MNTKNLDAFIAVAELSSFTKAASSLGISQPTVTARIKRLEQTFKARLLQRSADGTRLTPAGHRLHRYAQHIIQLAEVAQQTVTDTDAVRAALAVGAAEDLAAYRLVPLIEYLYLRYSDLTVTFQSMDEDPWTLVRERRIDCALFIDAPTAATDVHSRLLCPEPLALVSGSHHPLAAATEVTLADLRSSTVICAHRTSGYQIAFERVLTGVEAHKLQVLSFGSISAVKRGLAEGFGVALLPRITVAEELRAGKVRQLGWKPSFRVFSQITWRPEMDSDAALQTILRAATQVTSEQVTDPPENGGVRLAS